ncbi:hypothetical protein, partial [Amycolatopsis solani]|uniref:hypothetical protein n=1 Tax=Amycolatopsis solani TaxID=3028615 RepID=UPI0025B12873
MSKRTFVLGRLLATGVLAAGLVPAPVMAATAPQVDKLNRGVVSVHTAAGNRGGGGGIGRPATAKANALVSMW